MDQERTKVLAGALSKQFSPNPAIHVRMQARIKYIIDHELDLLPKRQISEEMSEEDIQPIIKTTKERKAPGKDQITNLAIKNLPDTAIRRIVTITNAVLKYSYF